MATTINIRHLRSFVAVAETSSFTKAASKLFLTQSTLTANVKHLEEATGVKLFDRTTRSVALTPAAAKFHDSVVRLLGDFDTVLGDLTALGKSEGAHLRIAVSPSVVGQLLIPSLPAFLVKYPGVTLSVRDAGSPEIEERVLTGDVDFGICTKLSGHAELDYTVLLQDSYGVLSSDNHPLATSAKPIAWSQLGRYSQDWIGLASDTWEGSSHHELLRNIGLTTCSIEIASSTSLASLLDLGGRFSIIPFLTRFSHGLAKFPFRRLTQPVIRRELCLVSRRLRSISPSAVALSETLRQAASRLKGLQ